MRVEQDFPLVEIESDGELYRHYDIPYKNLYDTLQATAIRFPGKIGIIDAVGEITYKDFKQKVDDFAAYLSAVCGIGVKSRVAIMMVNSIEFCIAFYAVQKLGAVVVSINSKLSADEISYILHDSAPTCIVVDGVWLSKAEQAIASAHIPFCIQTSEPSDLPYPVMSSCITIGASLPAITSTQDSSLPAEIMYTSGSTGKPKAAVITHANLLQGLYAYAKADNMDDTEVTVLSIPVFHITGLNCVLTLFVFLGAQIILSPYFDAIDTLEKMTKYRATYLHAVSTVFILLEKAIQPHHDLSCLRTALCGGSFISRKIIQRFCQKAPNCSFHPVYGMTETSGAGTFFYGHCLISTIQDSCGKVVDNCRIKIVDSHGEEVPPGTDGEICLKGPFVISSYLNSIDNENIVDGWLHSGDMGVFDADGNLYIKDRIKDMINRGGEKIFSLAVENAIIKYGNVSQVAVFSVDDSLYGEVPGAVIVPEIGRDDICLDDLRQFLRQHLAHYKIPVYIEIRSSLPSTANGKVKKNILRAEFNQNYAK